MLETINTNANREEYEKNPNKLASSREVCVIPEFRDNPDIAKLARAVISIAKRSAERKAAEERLLDNNLKTMPNPP